MISPCPFPLSYNYSGFRPEEYPGSIGTGWTLIANGVINRQVRGLADESEGGYNGLRQNGLKVLQYLNQQMTAAQRTAFLNGVAGGQIDSEPDMFVLSGAGGLNGKFFFDEGQCASTAKNPVLIPHQRLGIRADFDYARIYNIKRGAITRFTLNDAQGVIYRFETVEAPANTVEKGDPDRDNFPNTWPRCGHRVQANNRRLRTPATKLVKV